ncbi:MAG: UDP-N-acetylglucosamine--N-acetylmuramyl-(pentapeptide) pyrophosphoryl-undecaprenol N-acetylglucosamine transferase [Chloroflexi bacterium]|nr:UDP-N-acetylglucosamine--N-acetylmuramyl-(pentapeptide) pyrophosphoryl-undecaprenol N-acetylglucosamine transferase [Chloroflexota bacterium]MBV9896231.1 UDP-N-acetylglucosamine--N-acetylmuramyl-(pentapeptide) pyrophosphoryl-undecaprenol N-acetylglucosamine transferase [Chloroflexota bacterium]
MTARVLLAGGGSGGSATPVLAVAQALRRHLPDVELLYVGTRDGPEAQLAAAHQIPFVSVQSGKLRRYWDLQNLTDPFRVIAGIGQAYAVARRFRPQVAMAAGGFAAVPPMVAARLVGARTLIHQQDVQPGLANRLLVPVADRITVSLASSLGHFPRNRTTVTGNPVREEILHADATLAYSLLRLEPEVPLVVVTGGGTGALGLNRIVATAAPQLVAHAQVVHLTGKGRGVPRETDSRKYTQVEFLVDEMPHLLAAATVVVSRAGMGTLTELAALAKATIVVPMPGSHQWANAAAFARMGAVEVADQSALTPERLAERVVGLLNDKARRGQLGRALAASMPRDAADRIALELLSRKTQ